MPVPRWGPTVHRKIEAARDRILRGLGTDEPLIDAAGELAELAAMMPGYQPRSRQWRKPMRVDEIAQLAPTPEVRARPGRP